MTEPREGQASQVLAGPDPLTKVRCAQTLSSRVKAYQPVAKAARWVKLITLNFLNTPILKQKCRPTFDDTMYAWAASYNYEPAPRTHTAPTTISNTNVRSLKYASKNLKLISLHTKKMPTIVNESPYQFSVLMQYLK